MLAGKTRTDPSYENNKTEKHPYYIEMKNISTLLTFVSVVLLLSSCTSHSFMLTERDLANDGVHPIQQAEFKTVANKSSEVNVDANAKWMAASRPHVVSTSERIARRTEAVELSAATTVEGHELLKREVGKAMKKEKSAPKSSTRKEKTKKQQKAEGKVLL
ncbi:hypothetical protein [uncultured Pontibacter sp.]|uniref:hypothetical protein n=1 Tax=uncultured Pontibacter sp. TaxID=453356 RepID=UPI0026201A17|nr:hypothetical protein [uncultured Pontibacter sp.]